MVIANLLATGSDSCKDRLSLHFSKMHGLGNDFVMVEDIRLADIVDDVLSEEGDAALFDCDRLRQLCSQLAIQVCSRNFGVGGDGLIIAINLQELAKRVAKSRFYAALQDFISTYPALDRCRLAWIYVNSDGSYSSMCGNGLRCLTLFAGQLGWLTDTCTVATAAYPVQVELQSGDTIYGGADFIGLPGSDVAMVLTRLAGPRFKPEEIPLDLSALAGAPSLNSFVDQNIQVGGLTLAVTCVSMGNPHCVIFEQAEAGLSLAEYVADIKAAHAAGKALLSFPRRLLLLAADIQQLSLFPEGVNVEFVAIDKDNADTALAFVVERGCGATLACASGAAAVAAAGAISGHLNKRSYVILPGGKLEVNLSSVQNNEYIELTGPAVKTFSGDVSLSLSDFCVSSAAANGGKDAGKKAPPKSAAQSKSQSQEGSLV